MTTLLTEGDTATYYHRMLDITLNVRVVKVTKTRVRVHVEGPAPVHPGIQRNRSFTHRQAEELLT